MTNITEIAPDVYRLSIHVKEFDLQFNHFLVKDEEPLLFHTGMRKMFAPLHEAVSKIIPPSKLRWVAFSHFEVDECGALNEWLQVAQSAQPVCSLVGALVNMGDFSLRPARGMQKDDALETGKYRFRFRPTPHLPHGWDAGVLFEETQRTLFCSDLFHQVGEREPLTESDVVGASKDGMIGYQKGPLMDYMPFTTKSKSLLEGLAALKPKTLAIMHGSSFRGDCSRALNDLGEAMEDVFGRDAS